MYKSKKIISNDYKKKKKQKKLFLKYNNFYMNHKNKSEKFNKIYSSYFMNNILLDETTLFQIANSNSLFDKSFKLFQQFSLPEELKFHLKLIKLIFQFKVILVKESINK